MDFFQKEGIMDASEVKNVLMLDLFQLFVFLQMLTDGLECCDVLSDSHSDGTHSLQSIHC